MAGVFAWRGDLEPIVIARKSREGSEHLIRDRLCLIDNDSHLGAGFVKRVTPFGFTGIICDETFDFRAGIITSDQELNDLKDLAAI